MSYAKIGILTLCVIFLIGCGKEGFEIGREDPDKEIQKCVFLSQKKRYAQAVECLEIFKSRFAQSPQGREVELKIADNYFQQKQYLLAADTYQSFVNLNPSHPLIDYALFRTGLSYLYEAPKAIDRDQQYLVKAHQQFQLALRTTPNSTYREIIIKELKNVEASLAKRLFYVGRFYFRTGEYLAAIPRFEELIEKYPDSPLAPKAFYHVTRAHLALGKQEDARQALEDFSKNFPNNPWTKKAQARYFSNVKKEK